MEIYVTSYIATTGQLVFKDAYLALPRCTKHMTKDGQVCFHRRLFADPVKPQRCTTESVRPLDGIDKDVGSAKLLLTTTSVYPVDCACIYPLLKTQNHCVLMEGVTHLWLPTHPLIHTIPDITVAVKKVAQNPAVLAS